MSRLRTTSLRLRRLQHQKEIQKTNASYLPRDEDPENPSAFPRDWADNRRLVLLGSTCVTTARLRLHQYKRY